VLAVPRDIEALEELANNLHGVTDDAHSWRVYASTYVEFFGLGKGFAVVAGEVKELARETADATKRVSEQITALQASAESVSGGIRSTSETIGQLDGVQTRINEVLEEQTTMAHALQT
jgi:hypothetical protein